MYLDSNQKESIIRWYKGRVGEIWEKKVEVRISNVLEAKSLTSIILRYNNTLMYLIIQTTIFVSTIFNFWLVQKI